MPFTLSGCYFVKCSVHDCRAADQDLLRMVRRLIPKDLFPKKGRFLTRFSDFLPMDPRLRPSAPLWPLQLRPNLNKLEWSRFWGLQDSTVRD